MIRGQHALAELTEDLFEDKLKVAGQLLYKTQRLRRKVELREVQEKRSTVLQERNMARSLA